MHHAYQTALVTGASSGIGQCLATLLAEDGRDLVILARRTALLEALATRLREEHKVSVEVLTADLTSPAGLAAAEARLSDPDRPIELLVNNAGFGSSGSFADLPAGTAEDQIRLNVTAVVRLTHAALPGMLQRGHGGVLNVSSVAGFVPSPGAATYGATKAFVTSFTEAVHEEVKEYGVKVTVLCPGFTRTGFQATADVPAEAIPGFMWQEADDVAREGLDALAKNKAIAIPGNVNKVLGNFSIVTPHGITRRIGAAVLKRSGA